MTEPEYHYVKGVGWVPCYEETHTFTTNGGLAVTFVSREPQLGEFGNYVEADNGSWYYADGKVQLKRLEDWGRSSIYKRGDKWHGARPITEDYLQRMKLNPKAVLFTIVIHEP